MNKWLRNGLFRVARRIKTPRYKMKFAGKWFIKYFATFIFYLVGAVGIWMVFSTIHGKKSLVPRFFHNFEVKIKFNDKSDLSNSFNTDTTNARQFSDDEKTATHPVILVWTTSGFINMNAYRLVEFVADKECGSCRITMDRSTLNQSIAVIIFNDDNSLKDLDLPDPKTRSPKQTYVFWSREPPGKTFFFKHLLDHPRVDPIFNLTMFYTRNSDIRRYFGTHRAALENSKEQSLTSKNIMSKKTSKLAIWIVSNCHRLPGAIERMLYAKSLVKAGLKLEKVGECFDGKKDRGRIQHIVSEYKFYLAFENSLHCPDYMTEKFWRNSLHEGLVPIVWGPTKEDALDLAPPNSFIHSEDFKTPENLVKYLNYLHKNDTAYMEYHKWRDAPLESVPPDDHADGIKNELCRLCRRLVLENHPPKTIPSISNWLYETGYPDDKCVRPFSKITKEEALKMFKF